MFVITLIFILYDFKLSMGLQNNTGVIVIVIVMVAGVWATVPGYIFLIVYVHAYVQHISQYGRLGKLFGLLFICMGPNKRLGIDVKVFVVCSKWVSMTSRARGL